MKLIHLIFVSFILFTSAAGARAKGSPVTIHVKAVKGGIEFSYRGRRLTDSSLDELCATSRKHKTDIEFQKDKMNSEDTVAAILKQAKCLGATHIGFTGVDQYPDPKSATQTQVQPRRKSASPR